jgi:hypothetical protein
MQFSVAFFHPLTALCRADLSPETLVKVDILTTVLRPHAQRAYIRAKGAMGQNNFQKRLNKPKKSVSNHH